MIDYVIVGSGLAGICFAETATQNEKRFVMISDHSQNASLVAAGMYNPLVLKRFTMAWQASKQLDLAMPFYQRMQERLSVQFDHKLRVARILSSVEEQNNWFVTLDKPTFGRFMSSQLLSNNNTFVKAPHQLGEVKETGRIDTLKMRDSFVKALNEKQQYIAESFDYNALEIKSDHIVYKEIKAKNIIFAEGYGLKQNPWFNYLPLVGTKGEYLSIYAPALKEEKALKSACFLIPLGGGYYKVGATYKWQDKTSKTTLEAREELIQKLKKFITVDFEVVDQVAGIRPTVTDRRPLVGRHPDSKLKRLFVLNGFGSRGVLIGPYAAQALMALIEEEEPLDAEMDISRFSAHWPSDQKK